MDTSSKFTHHAKVLEIGFGFAASQVLSTAVRFDLFTLLNTRKMTGEAIQKALKWHPRGVWDFLDTLVAMHILERDGQGAEGQYYNSELSLHCLHKESEYYIGDILLFIHSRLYLHWNNLHEALLTGQPQNELKHAEKGEDLFNTLYAETEKLEHFIQAMSSLTKLNAKLLAEKIDFTPYKTVCDVGGASAIISTTLAKKHPHLQLTTFDLPEVGAYAQKNIDQAKLQQRIQVVSGDFFVDAIPKSDVIIMSLILHDWNLEKKMYLIQSAYDALSPKGALIVVEHLIDDARRENIAGLFMSLNMLIELGDAFDYTFADYKKWCTSVGFKEFSLVPLLPATSAAIAYK